MKAHGHFRNCISIVALLYDLLRALEVVNRPCGRCHHWFRITVLSQLKIQFGQNEYSSGKEFLQVLGAKYNYGKFVLQMLALGMMEVMVAAGMDSGKGSIELVEAVDVSEMSEVNGGDDMDEAESKWAKYLALQRAMSYRTRISKKYLKLIYG